MDLLGCFSLHECLEQNRLLVQTLPFTKQRALLLGKAPLVGHMAYYMNIPRNLIVG